MTNGRKIRPLMGQVLIYVDAPETVSAGGIAIPQQAQGTEQYGDTITGQVRSLGIWPLSKNGNLIPYDVKPGDRVLLCAGSGRWLKGNRERLKIVPADSILALVGATVPP